MLPDSATSYCSYLCKLEDQFETICVTAASRTRLTASATVDVNIVVVAAPDVRPVCRGSENVGIVSGCG